MFQQYPTYLCHMFKAEILSICLLRLATRALFSTMLIHHYDAACIFCLITMCPLINFHVVLSSGALYFVLVCHFKLTCGLVFHELVCLLLLCLFKLLCPFLQLHFTSFHISLCFFLHSPFHQDTYTLFLLFYSFPFLSFIFLNGFLGYHPWFFVPIDLSLT